MKRLKRNSGAALLTVLVALMLMSLMLFEFQYGAMVERKLAYNSLNQLQAYYLAKSGAHLAMLRTAVFLKAKKNPTVQKSTIPLNTLLDQIWSLPLPPFPPTKAEVSEMLKSDRDAAETALKQTKIVDGQFSHVISSESSKINLNFLKVPKTDLNNRVEFNCRDDQRKQYLAVGCALIRLIDGFLTESEDAIEEYGNIRPEEVVLNIMDWINPGSQSFSGGSKDAFYERQDPPYKAKRDRFYTLDEVRLVKGINEKLLEKLKPHITVYSDQGKINVNQASSKMFSALYPDFTQDDIKRMIEDREKMGGWPTESAFVDYVTKALGRTSFTNFYPDDKSYPFTVSSESFLIESLGQLVRSGSNIQKQIQVTLAASGAHGGSVDATLPDQNKCVSAPGHFWSSVGDCRWKPTSDAECGDLAGTVPSGGPPAGQKYCCDLPKFPMGTGTASVCVREDELSAFAKAGSLKILSWSET